MVTETGCWTALLCSWTHLESLLDRSQDSRQALGGTDSPGWTSSSWEIPAPPDPPLLLQFPAGTKLNYLQAQYKEEEIKVYLYKQKAQIG